MARKTGGKTEAPLVRHARKKDERHPWDPLLFSLSVVVTFGLVLIGAWVL